MSIKQGFGNVTEILANPYILGVPAVGANRNIIFQLPTKQEKRILDISCGWTVNGQDIINNSIRGLICGRLMVVGAAFNGFSDEIIPDSNDLPESLSFAERYYDEIIGHTFRSGQGAIEPYNVRHISKQISFSNGLLIPAGQDASVILTYCLEDLDDTVTEYMATTGIYTLAYLNVNGITGGSDKIFKSIR